MSSSKGFKEVFDLLSVIETIPESRVGRVGRDDVADFTPAEKLPPRAESIEIALFDASVSSNGFLGKRQQCIENYQV